VPPARPDLSGYTVVMVDEWAGAAPWLAAYFRTRGAAVVVTRTLPASIADPGPGATEKARQSNVVIFFTPDAEGFSPETSRHIRQQHFVPLIQGPTASAHNYRLALRAGFAALLPTAMDTDYLDRNIRLLMGHAPVRTWHDTDGIPSLGLDAQSLKEKRFLVLEDRLANQTIIQKQLRKLGIACTLVPNGLRGLDALKQERFDLILCDCSMPEMNGYDFTRAVRRQEAAAQDGRRIPIIAMTANAFREDAEQCFEAGMDDFISKPVTLARMATVLRSWLNPAAEVSESGNPVPMDVAERSRAIDMDLLAEMLGTDDRTELDEILTLFLPVARASLADMEKALSSGCAEAIAAAAHGAKGEAQSAAAIGLAGVYAEIERQTKGGNIDGLGAFGALAAAEVRRVEEFVGGQSDR